MPKARGRLIGIEDFDCFERVRSLPEDEVGSDALAAIRSLDERTELEPFLRSILSDPEDTPHGPAELVDILTHRVSVNGELGLAAFVLKGRSFSKVRPRHVAHQIYRLEKIDQLRFAILGASGTVLDHAKEQFFSTASRVAEGYSYFDALDLARLFGAYGFVCPRDGRRMVAGSCTCGFRSSDEELNVLQRAALQELREARERGERSALVVLPTGGGKTRLAVEDALAAGAESILYVAHTHEILDSAEEELAAVFGSTAVHRHEVGQSLTPLKKANLATIQSLSGRLSDLASGDIDHLVVDEFHRAAAKSYRTAYRASAARLPRRSYGDALSVRSTRHSGLVRRQSDRKFRAAGRNRDRNPSSLPLLWLL